MMTTFWIGRRVLITGIAGMIGSHLARTLLDEGARVVGADHLQDSPNLRALNVTCPVRWRDCTNISNMLLTLNEEQPTVVFHLAGFSHIGPAQQDPEAAFQANVVGTFGMLEACRRYHDGTGRLDAVVVSSSNHVFGDMRQRPWRPAFREWDALEPHDTYGGTKACADILARVYRRGYGLPVVALRHVNAYGPGGHPSHIVTATIQSVLRGERPVIKSDGSPRKGYLYIDDVVDAYVKAAMPIRASALSTSVFNVAPDAPISVLELVREILAAAESDLEPRIEASDLSQKDYYEYLDSSLFRRVCGWAPTVPLPIGLRWTVDWLKAHPVAPEIPVSGERHEVRG